MLGKEANFYFTWNISCGICKMPVDAKGHLILVFHSQIRCADYLDKYLTFWVVRAKHFTHTF